MLKIPKIP